jgi:hypothetical protein
MIKNAIKLTLVVLSFNILSCSSTTLNGEWKTVRVKFVNLRGPDTTIDLSEPQKLKANMLTSLLNEREKWRSSQDVAKMKADIESNVKLFLETGLNLSHNDQFEMVSNGLIISNSIPGWNFGNVISGTWTGHNDILTLATGKSSKDYQWTFKVLELTRSTLRIKQVQQGVIGDKESMLGPEDEIEFKRK